MAWSGPALTKVVAAANGTNNFALSDPSSQGPYRTDVQAVADGSLVNGRTVHYGAWRTTTENDAEFEEGHGVYTAATRTIARTAGNVLDGSNGPGVLVDFGLSGQMDILFYPVLDGSNIPSPAEFATNLGLPRLAAANTYQLDQNAFTLHDFKNQNTGSSAAIQLRVLSDVANMILVGNSSTRSGSRFGTALASRAEVVALGTPLNIGTTGANNILFGTNGALVAQMTGAGVFQDASGNKYVAFQGGDVVKQLFGSALPIGWNVSYETNSSVIRLAKSGDTIGATGGSDDIFDGAWATAALALAVSQMAAHTHTVPITTAVVQSGTGAIGVASGSFQTESTGDGAPHSHNITAPYYRIAVWGTFA